MSASVPPVKTVMDVELADGQWRQYTTEVLHYRKPGTVITDTVTSLLEVAAEDLRIEELDVGIIGMYMDRFPLRPGYQVRTCEPLRRRPYPDRAVDFLHQLARFWQDEQPHSGSFTFDYELPPQEFQDSEVLKALEFAFHDWCTQFDIGRRSFQALNGIPEYSTQEAFEASFQRGLAFPQTVLTVRVFQRTRFARIREKRVMEARRLCFRHLELKLHQHLNDKLTRPVLKFEVSSEKYRYFSRSDFQEVVKILGNLYAPANAMRIILPGDNRPSPDDEGPLLVVTLKDED